MCVVCAAGGGNLGAGVSTILGMLTAFSPVVGIFAYRVYKATSIRSYAQKPKWAWWTGGLLAAYTTAIYSLLALLSYGLAEYSKRWADVVLLIALILIPLFWFWFGRQIQKVRPNILRIQQFILPFLGAIPFFVIIILFASAAAAPSYTAQTEDIIHYLNTLYGLYLPLLLFVSCTNILFFTLYFGSKPRK